MDWLDLFAVQGTLKSLLQHHSSKASILWSSAFFIVQLSHPYMTTGKIIALTRWTFVGKVISMLINMLSRLIITFLTRSKRLNFMAAITICSDFGAQENEVCLCCQCFHIYLPWSDGTGCHDLSFLNIVLSQLFHSLLSLSSRSSLVLRFLQDLTEDFPGGVVVKTLCFHCRVHGFDPGPWNWDPACCPVQLKKIYRM